MYLLDSNIYINFYDRYYKIDFFPTFWNKLTKILNEKVVIVWRIPDLVWVFFCDVEPFIEKLNIESSFVGKIDYLAENRIRNIKTK